MYEHILKWRSKENSKELALPFYHMGPRNETQVINRGEVQQLGASWPKGDATNEGAVLSKEYLGGVGADPHLPRAL